MFDETWQGTQEQNDPLLLCLWNNNFIAKKSSVWQHANYQGAIMGFACLWMLLGETGTWSTCEFIWELRGPVCFSSHLIILITESIKWGSVACFPHPRKQKLRPTEQTFRPHRLIRTHSASSQFLPSSSTSAGMTHTAKSGLCLSSTSRVVFAFLMQSCPRAWTSQPLDSLWLTVWLLYTEV